MGAKSKISWADATWNPIAGCRKVSEGCRNCYAIRDAYRMVASDNPKIAEKYRGTTRLVGSRPEWTGRVNLWPAALDLPLNWTKPSRIFVNSMSDLFHENVPNEFILQVFSVMARAPHHIFQILTKRERVKTFLKDHRHILDGWDPWPWPHVHIGVSCEDPETWYERVPWLMDIEAAVRWVSVEPLINCIASSQIWHSIDYIDWIVVGGESGPNARPCDPNWMRRFRDAARDARIPFFLKQMGGRGLKRNWSPIPPDLLIQEYPDVKV